MKEYLSVNGKDYKVIKLLGHGKGGYSYLVENIDGIKFVLKQIHHEPCDYYTSGNKIESEFKDYNTLLSIGISLPKMIDIDFENERIIKEYIDGKTIVEYVCNNLMTSNLYDQIKDMCKLLYSKNINIDYYPTNFIVRNVDNKLFYIDYECNIYDEKWNYENWGSKYWKKTEEFKKAFESEVKNGKD